MYTVHGNNFGKTNNPAISNLEIPAIHEYLNDRIDFGLYGFSRFRASTELSERPKNSRMEDQSFILYLEFAFCKQKMA